MWETFNMCDSQEAGEMTREKVTVSLIKADVGGFPGYSTVREELKEEAEKRLKEARDAGLLIDYCVMNAGDDLQLLMSHRKGVDAEAVSYTHLTLPTKA